MVGSPKQVTFKISTLVPEMDVQGNLVSIVDGDTTPSLTDHTDFGSTNVVGSTVVRTFTVRNTGTAQLNLSGTPKVVVGGAQAAEFTVTAQPSSPVAAAGTTTFQVTFAPAGTGLRSATLSITNDDSNENPYNFAIQGTGTANTYTVTFNGQGGTTPSPTFKTVTNGLTYGTLATTTRTGHTFGGWWTGTNGTGTQITSATTVTITAAQTLYALWPKTVKGTHYLWLDQYGLVAGGNYEAADVGDTDGDKYAAWQEYIAGTVPTNRASVFKSLVTMSNGLPRVAWTPDLGTGRVYAVEGRTNLTSGGWGTTNASSRYFRVKVGMP
jgi:hypothetical protein